MARQRKYTITLPTYTCPHCGHVNSVDNLVRLDWDRVQCKQCGEGFTAIPDAKKPPAADR